MSEPVPEKPLRDIRPAMIAQMLSSHETEDKAAGHQPDAVELKERTRRVVIYAERAARQVPLFEPDQH